MLLCLRVLQETASVFVGALAAGVTNAFACIHFSLFHSQSKSTRDERPFIGAYRPAFDYAWACCAICLRNSALNTVRTTGWIRNSCVNHAKGKLKHISFSQSASRVRRLKPFM